MITENLQKIMREEIAKLPKENQEAINSINWGDIVEEIGVKFLLTDEEIDTLQQNSGLVLLGIERLDLIGSGVENMGETNENAKKITAEIFEKVFEPIANKIESFVKNKIKNTTPKWDQSVNFIISGGDYSNFVDN